MPLPNEATSIAAAALLIQKCASTNSLRKARRLHALLITSSTPTFPKSPYEDNNIISMYARCGSLADSHLLFDKMPQRNIVSYNSLIAAYSRSHHHTHLSFNLFSQLRQIDCLTPNGSTFTSLLQASSSLQNPFLGSALHAQTAKSGFLSGLIVQTSLLGMYSNCGDLYSASRIFSHLDDKDATAWNSIIFGYMKNDEIVKGLNQFGFMKKSGVFATQFTYSMVLNACSRLKDHETGRTAHAQVIVSGTMIDLPLHNALLDMYCSCGDTQTALTLFDKIANPDIVSWNSMISGYSDNGDGENAMDMFVKQWRISLYKPDEYTFASVISSTSSFPASDYGKPLHSLGKKMGLATNVYVGTTLVSMYFNNFDSESAQKVFNSVHDKDIVLWTEMISGHCKMDDGEGAIKSFCLMLREGHKIDSFALSSALSSCADLAALGQGEMIHSQVVKTGYEVEMTVCGSLVDMYAKIGNLKAAENVLLEVEFPDVKCWNSMLGGYGHHGKVEEAIKLFHRILNLGLAPDQVTFVSLLSVFSHCGLVEEGRITWKYMNEMGIKPGTKHYSCMITMLSRAGLLEEAEKMITDSPFCDDHLELWRILLSSCVVKRDLRIGMRAAEKVLRVDLEDPATNVLLTNLYAATGRWEGVAEMRRKIKGLMVEKDPGLSWVEVMGGVHVFSCGDELHEKIDEIRTQLDYVQGNMRKL